jgi:hypothetical protein
MVKSIISLHLDIDPDSFAVRRSNIIGLPRDIAGKVRKAMERRGRLAEYQAQANEATIEAVNALTGEGITLRDTSYLLGLSHQRVSQLAGGSTER